MSLRRALGASVALLLAVAASACDGDGSGVPRDATVGDFCDAYLDLYSEEMRDIDPSASQEDQDHAMVAAFRGWADEMEKVGTPEEMSDEARAGLDLIVGAAADLEAGSVDNLAQLDDGFTDDQVAAIEAFGLFGTQNCESPFGDSPTS